MPAFLGPSGNRSRPAPTCILAEAMAPEVVSPGRWSAACFNVVDACPALRAAFSQDQASQEHRQLLDSISACDALVVGPPVCHAGFEGLLKHFFDPLDSRVLSGKPVVFCATGKASQHAFVIDHKLRPHFAFFGTWSLPTEIYATDMGLQILETVNDALNVRISKAADELRAFKCV
jgi:FMN reductase